MLRAAITVDVDTLASIYKGQGCRRPQGYTYAELRIGLENLARFLEPYGAKATLFMVGKDFIVPGNQSVIRAIADAGFEIANHTFSHPQGFRLLTREQKENEIGGMEELCQQVIGKKPVGFRAPGWNVGDDALSILKRRGYLYDSSVFPTLLTPLLKGLHWYAMRSRAGGDRTTLGHWYYMFAPIQPFQTGNKSLARPGDDGLVEFPISVTPWIRLPFFATFTMRTGLDLFHRSYQAIKSADFSLQYQLHLSDFVDYATPELADQVPATGKGLYVPQALGLSLAAKLDLLRPVLDKIAKDYSFFLLDDWARSILGGAA